MKSITLGALLCAAAAFPTTMFAQQPTCNRCSASYIEEIEIDAYATRAEFLGLTDQQIRAVDIGKSNVAVGVVYRGPLSTPGAAAEHDLVSEVYHVISGEATIRTGWDIQNMERRPPDNRAVVLLNGPGNNGTAIRNGQDFTLKTGDVLIIPAGVGHQFMRIDDHIEYLMIRIDPDKAAPLKDEAASREDLSGE